MEKKWNPISETGISDIINRERSELTSESSNLWEMIRISPQKWEETSYGKAGHGFWVVALYGNGVVWYNDIEEGFNISSWIKFGKIEEYFCNQDSLLQVTTRILGLIHIGGSLHGHSGPPQQLKSTS